MRTLGFPERAGVIGDIREGTRKEVVLEAFLTVMENVRIQRS